MVLCTFTRALCNHQVPSSISRGFSIFPNWTPLYHNGITNVSFSPPISSWIIFFFFSFRSHGKTHNIKFTISTIFMYSSVVLNMFTTIHLQNSSYLKSWNPVSIYNTNQFLEESIFELWAETNPKSLQYYTNMQNIQEHFWKGRVISRRISITH